MSNILIAVSLMALLSCRNTSQADLIIYNARIYTVDATFSTAEAMVVRDGRIVALGTSAEITQKYFAKNKVNASGSFIYPGFIDAHAHFFSYGLGLNNADLVGTKSWEEILQKLQAFAKENPEGWLKGRGWDQTDWAVKEFPDRAELDRLFPDRPVILTRVDGHAAIVNQKALDVAGITTATRIEGGEFQMKDGRLNGVLIDNAIDLVTSRIPTASIPEIVRSLNRGQQNCFAVGLTSVVDCGVDIRNVMIMDSLQKKGELNMRVYAMLSDNATNLNWIAENEKIKTDFMHVRSLKAYSDGALGSRGACLLQPYSDRPNWFGFLLSPVSHFDSLAAFLDKHDFQMCTHAIGDSANRMVLQTYKKHLKGNNDKRWRIEHAQVVNENDFGIFGGYSIIPSVQPTHATSDMYWAGERLGKAREKGAYAYRELLVQNGWIPLGTDFPVEDISPFKTFYAAVFRIDANGFPKEGYQAENALSREQALRGMTIWAAKGSFEEDEKGSLEAGKFADFIIVDQDLMKAAPKEVLNAKVLATYVGGKKVYGK